VTGQAHCIVGRQPGSQATRPDPALKSEPDRAMATLRRMGAAGFLQPEVLKTSPDLAPLRDRKDSQLLVSDLTKSPQPTGKK
jgi:hypothetical protein